MIAEEEDDDQIELLERPRCLRWCAAWARAEGMLIMVEYSGKRRGGRRSGHGADVDDEPDLCKVMAWGVNVSIKPCRARRRPASVRQEEVRVEAMAGARVWRLCARVCGACVCA